MVGDEPEGHPIKDTGRNVAESGRCPTANEGGGVVFVYTQAGDDQALIGFTFRKSHS